MAGKRKRSGFARRVKHAIEYALLRLVLFLLTLLPVSASMWVARRLGDFAFDIVRLRRQVTLENLERALGSETSAGERRRIARACYRNMGMTFIELTLLGPRGIDALGERVRFIGTRHCAAAAREGKGVIYLTAHVGSWEVSAAATSLVDRPLTVVFAEQRNRFVDRYVRRSRERLGLVMIPVGFGLRGMMRALQAGSPIGIAGDQDAGPEGLPIPFLGRDASTAVGPARMAYRTGAPIVIALDRHLGGGRHEIAYFPCIHADRARPEEEETRRILGEYARTLEEFVRRHPEQYFWMHRRWKTVFAKAGGER